MSIETNLAQFTGTEHYYKHFLGIVYTDGVNYLAEKAKAYWLIDVIASYQPQQKKVPFQLWEFKKTGDAGVVTMREDTGEPELVRQEIEYTDFPLDEIKFYLIDGVLLLPSEY